MSPCRCCSSSSWAPACGWRSRAREPWPPWTTCRSLPTTSRRPSTTPMFRRCALRPPTRRTPPCARTTLSTDPCGAWWPPSPTWVTRPEVARVTASALATAAEGLTPLLEVSEVLDPASLYSDGRIAVDELRAAAEPLAMASADLDAAAAEIATAPAAADGAWVPASLDTQRADAAEQLIDAAAALDTAAAAADVLPALLGADGPRRWFVGSADAGRSTRHRRAGRQLRRPARRTTAGSACETTGSNSDFCGAARAARTSATEFEARYGQDPRLFTNSNRLAELPRRRRAVAGLLRRLPRSATPTSSWAPTSWPFGELIARHRPHHLAGRSDARRARRPSTSPCPACTSAYPDREERKLFQEAVATAVFDKHHVRGRRGRSARFTSP